MTDQRTIQTFTMDWQGITLSVSYEADWLNMGDRGRHLTAHLQVEAINPQRAPLPITETGYRSHFLPAATVEEHGGPVAFVVLWLDGSTRSTYWKAYLKEQKAMAEASRQLSLF